MKIFSLKIQNFLSFKNYYRVFENDEIISIIGENLSGKSALIDAIIYAITGITRASKETDMIHHNEKVMKVTLVLIDDGVRHIIIRGRDYKNKGMLSLNNITKSKEAQNAIYELIGVNDKELKMTAFFNASNASMFMELSSSEKKKYLMNWLQNGHWERLKELASNDLANLKSESLKLQGQLVALSNSKRDKQINRQQYDELNQLIIKIEKDIEILNNKKSKDIETLYKYNKKIHTEALKLNQVKSVLQDKKRHLKQNEENAITYNDICKKIKPLGLKLQHFRYKSKCLKIGEIRRREIVLKTRKAEHKEKIKAIKKNRTGICPVLLIKCIKIRPNIQDAQKLEGAVLKIEKELESVQKILHEFEIHTEYKRKYDNLSDMRDAIKKPNKNTSLKEEISNLTIAEKKISDRIRILKVKVSEMEKIQDFSDIIKNLKSKKDDAIKKVAVYRSIVLENRKIKNKIKLINTKIQKVAKEVFFTSYICNAFSNTGIPSMEIENSFSDIEDEINSNLNQLNPNLELVFSPDKELRKKESKCSCGFLYPKGYSKKICEECGVERKFARKDVMSLDIIENGEKVEFNQLSSGGKIIVSMSVRVALMRLLRRRYNCNFNSLFFDEIDGTLDEKHIRKVRLFVKNVLIKEFGYSQVFWISHNAMLKNNASITLEISKKNGVSIVNEL